MTATTNNFAAVAELMHDETVTHSYVNDVALPSGKTLALLTLDNGLDHKKPTTLGPNGLLNCGRLLKSKQNVPKPERSMPWQSPASHTS